MRYASAEYVAELGGAGARVSMPGEGNPCDNAEAESSFKTLKHEEVRLKEYRTFEEAEADIGRFVEDLYNTKRLHSSLGYLPPAELEAARTAADAAARAGELTLVGVR